MYEEKTVSFEEIFKIPSNIMKVVMKAAIKFRALLLRARVHKHKHTRLRLHTENDPCYENGRLLQLKGRLIKPVPPDLFSLIELTTLDMSASRESNLDYLLDRLPVELICLKNLRCLHIDVNNISLIPTELGDLVNLEKLTLTNNKLTCLPSSFTKLKKLTSLHLANNSFEHFPIVICSLTNLKFLDFSNNQLTILPDQIGDLKYLEILLLFNNLLEGIPDTLCDLKNLKTLWLGDNFIRKLPQAICNLKNLDWEHSQLSSNVNGNPLVDPPLDVCNKGVKAIASYYRVIGRRKSSQRITDGRKLLPNKVTFPKIPEKQDRKQSLRNFDFAIYKSMPNLANAGLNDKSPTTSGNNIMTASAHTAIIAATINNKNGSSNSLNEIDMNKPFTKPKIVAKITVK